LWQRLLLMGRRLLLWRWWLLVRRLLVRRLLVRWLLVQWWRLLLRLLLLCCCSHTLTLSHRHTLALRRRRHTLALRRRRHTLALRRLRTLALALSRRILTCSGRAVVRLKPPGR
jgi:hypothetical protein